MKRNFFRIVCLIFITITFWGCNKEDSDIGLTDAIPEGSVEKELADIDLSGLNGEAKLYCDLIQTAVFATNSHKPVISSRVVNGEEVNPLREKLKEMEIWGENGNQISFFSLPEAEQAEFLSDWAVFEAAQMTEKIRIDPEVEEYIRQHNEIIVHVLGEESIGTRGINLRVKDNKAFFAKIRERMESLSESAVGQPETKGSITDKGKVPFERVRAAVAKYGRVGDFMLALPRHGAPWVFLNFAHDQFKVGHAAIIKKGVTLQSEEEYKFTWGCQIKQGVMSERLDYWSVKSYVMGIRKVSWRWKWRGFKSRLVIRKTPVSQPARLANRAAGYEGRKYVNWSEFLTAKWAAPSRFTCTTLVWYCAKKEYGVNVSSWWSPLVSPSGLYLDESTYVRKAIR